MDLTGVDNNNVSDLFAFLFENLAGYSGVIYTDNMWLRLVGQVQAWRPIPFNKAVSMDPNVDLSWEPGIDANTHDVYFGTRFADVNDANRSSAGIFKGNQPLADANYDPGTLERLTTYYWRIDEVSSGGSPICKGDVWSFKTAPVKYVEIPLTSYEDSDTRYSVWKGLSIAGDTDDSLTLGDKLKGGSTWVVNGVTVTVPTASDGDNVLGLQWNNEADLEVEHGCTFAGSGFTFDLDGIDEIAFDVYYDYHNAEGGFNPLPHSIGVFDWRFVPAFNPSSNLPTTRGEWHTIVIDVSHLKNKGLDSIYDFMLQAHGEDFDPNDADPNNWGALMYMDNLRLRYYVAELACGPDPANRATDVDRDADLSWLPGVYAADVNGHKVYFDPDKQKVTDRSGCDVNGVSTTDPCYGPIGPLNLGQTYYWRVDEVNNAGPDPCFWPGDVWSFTVANYIVVDDFDSYECTSTSLCGNKALRAVWTAASQTGAAVSLQTGNDANLVHDGNSMKYDYDNYYAFYSEAYANTAALPSGIGSNWKVGGVKALTLWFYGKAGNDANEQMYVKLTDSASKSAKIIYDGDADDVREAQWHEWNIALQEFVDACSVLNLANVSRITIGFGDGIDPSPAPNPAGTVYFDDIRLYIPRCMPGTVPDSASGNCLIDYPDLLILTNNWLISEYDVVPVEPNNNNLIGWWKLDEGAGTIAADSSIYDNDGNLAGDPNSHPQWVAGHIGSGALDFNGVHDYVDCSNDVNLNEPNITGKVTLSAWVKTNDCGNGQFNPYITKGDFAYTLQHRAPLGTNINELEIALYSAGTGTWYFASTPVDSSFNGVWHHLAGTYDGSKLKLYIDGELKAITNYVGPIATSTANVNLGKSSDFTDRWYDGALDDVRIYKRALSQGEVAYLAERSTFTQPLEPLLTPPNPGINLYKDGTIDLRDYAVLASKWLEEVLWP